MNRADRPVGEDDLQAHVDGRLPPDRVEAIERYLRHHPEVAADLERDRATLAALRDRLAFKAEEAIPARLRIARIREARRQRLGRRFASVAAVTAWFIVGGAAGWSASEAVRTPATPVQVAVMADEAIAAHRTFVVEVVHPVEVRADDEAHLVQWLSKRLGTPLKAPDLTNVGYRLMGGRLLPAGAGPAAMLMYEDDNGGRLTLYIKADEKAETSFHFVEEDGFSAFFWRDAGFGYVVTAEAQRERLMQVATDIYNQIDAARAAAPAGGL